MHADSLLTGPLEPTSEAYAIAKIAGIKLCEAYRRQHEADFVAAVPADAYGPGDDFSLEESHVVAALIRRMHEAKEAGSSELAIWGSGNQRREFIFVEDLARACMFVMEHYREAGLVNLGSGDVRSVRELAQMIRDVIGYQGELLFDVTRPNGMPLKGLDSSVLAGLGWRPVTPLADGIRRTYEWYLARRSSGSEAVHPAFPLGRS
jgi:GDP-L-fucose synthase